MSSSTLLTAAEVRELHGLCSSPERELASTWKAEHLRCLEAHRTRRSGRVTVLFPTDASALKWNTRHETQIRQGGHLATAAVATLVALLGGPASLVTGIVLGTTAAIVKDELQARVWYPRVARGWQLTIDHVCVYEQYPGSRFSVDATYTIFDHERKIQDRCVAARCSLPIDHETGIAEEIARRIVTMPVVSKTLTFG